MRSPHLRRVACAFSLFILAAAPAAAVVRAQGGEQTPPSRKAVFSTPAQIEEDLKAVPCESNSTRQKKVRALFEKMGAPASVVTVEKLGDVENVVARKQGTGDGVIVVGAHYDKVSHGCGAVDNWTGVVTVAHMYRTLKDMPLKKTVLFVAFGREEEGLFGSRAMAKAIPKEDVAKYCAMINVDSLGLGIPQAATNISSKKMLERAAELAKRMKIPFAQANIWDGDSDSSSFIGKKIPAISIHALSPDWPKVLHTNEDRAARVNTMSVFMSYGLAVALFGEVENSDCAAFR